MITCRRRGVYQGHRVSAQKRRACGKLVRTYRPSFIDLISLYNLNHTSVVILIRFKVIRVIRSQVSSNVCDTPRYATRCEQSNATYVRSSARYHRTFGSLCRQRERYAPELSPLMYGLSDVRLFSRDEMNRRFWVTERLTQDEQ